jgi:hypothetical protein
MPPISWRRLMVRPIVAFIVVSFVVRPGPSLIPVPLFFRWCQDSLTITP